MARKGDTMAKWNYPVIKRGSKLGIHTIRPNNTKAFVEQALAGGTHLSVVKAVDDFGTLQIVRELSPKTITVGRVSYAGEGLGLPELSGNLKELAEKLLARTTKKLQWHADDVDYWEPTNESDPVGAEGYALLAELHLHMMDIAEREGYKIALLVCCAGTPEWDEMEAIVNTGVFGRAKQGGHILALHEGVFGMDPVDKWWGGSIPGAPTVEGAGALCFRYRYLYHLLEQRDEVIPLVVSEIVFGGGYSQDNITPEEVMQRARWYDERAREDYYMLGFLPFTIGPTSGWTHQDYEWSYPALIKYVISIKDEPNGLPPKNEITSTDPTGPVEPTEPVDPGEYEGLPRAQYERTYVLLPPNADAAWARAVVDSTWDKRYTIGSSADDAGIGDLDVRCVIAVNPQDWAGETSLKDFYKQYYPGVEYRSVTAATPAKLAQKLADE